MNLDGFVFFISKLFLLHRSYKDLICASLGRTILGLQAVAELRKGLVLNPESFR
jgi:hypothetical protein